MLVTERDWDASGGSWETSGIASQNITRLLDEPEVTATQTLSESAKELAGRGIEELMSGALGSCENAACPE